MIVSSAMVRMHLCADGGGFTAEEGSDVSQRLIARGYALMSEPAGDGGQAVDASAGADALGGVEAGTGVDAGTGGS